MSAERPTDVQVVTGVGGAGTLARAALRGVPGLSRLPILRGTRLRRTDEAVTIARPAVTATRADVEAYAEVCGFPHKDTLPVTYPHLLAFPLHLAIMADPGFPLPALGLVHVENHLRAHRALPIGETFEVTVHAGPPAAHARGRTVDFDTEVRVAGEVVWTSRSRYLHRGRGSGEPAATTRRTDPAAAGLGAEEWSPLPGGIEWALPGDLGRRYGAVSGDRNPIHLHALTARAFGFSRPIAHGMWTKARCLAALENRLPEAVEVAVRFLKPIALPGRVQFATATEAGATRFEVRRPHDLAPHLRGRAVPLAGEQPA